MRFRSRKRSTAGNLQACRLHDGIVAPCLFNCAIDSGVFLAYAELQLATSLTPGDIVIADNPAARLRLCARQYRRALFHSAFCRTAAR